MTAAIRHFTFRFQAAVYCVTIHRMRTTFAIISSNVLGILLYVILFLSCFITLRVIQ